MILVTGPTGGLGSEIVRLGAHPLTTRLESPVTDMAAEAAARVLDWARLPPQRVPATVLICSCRATPVRDLLLKVFAGQGLDGSGIAAAPGRADDIPTMVGVPTPLPRGD